MISTNADTKEWGSPIPFPTGGVCATILFIDSVTISMASVTLLLTIVDMYMLSGCELIDTENISVSSQN
jgi:hypothetical protein